MRQQGHLFHDGAHPCANGALFSDDDRYRFTLTREWAPGRLIAFIGLNPSTADAENDDPTIRRCIGFAKREGGGRLLMLNLFNWRSTDPAALLGLSNPIGEPPEELARRWRDADLVICAWGAVHKTLRWRVDQARDLLATETLDRFRCLGRTKDGQPRHPLYLPRLQPLETWP